MTAAGPENQHGPGVCKTLLVPPGTSSSLQDPSPHITTRPPSEFSIHSCRLLHRRARSSLSAAAHSSSAIASTAATISLCAPACTTLLIMIEKQMPL